MVAATPSGGWIGTSPVIKGLGFPLGTRGQMFYLDPGRPNALAPRKRPRATLTPSLVTRDGEPYMAFGTPGGDGQDQWTLQFFINQVDFGMNIQEAIDAPTVTSMPLPVLVLPARLASGAGRRGITNTGRGDLRAGTPRPRGASDRPLDQWQGHGHPPRPGQRAHLRRRLSQAERRIRNRLVAEMGESAARRSCMLTAAQRSKPKLIER